MGKQKIIVISTAVVVGLGLIAIIAGFVFGQKPTAPAVVQLAATHQTATADPAAPMAPTLAEAAPTPPAEVVGELSSAENPTAGKAATPPSPPPPPQKARGKEKYGCSCTTLVQEQWVDYTSAHL